MNKQEDEDVYEIMGRRFDMPTNKLVEQYNATITLGSAYAPLIFKEA